MQEGHIKYWSEKGYGFIRPVGGGVQPFVYIADITPQDVTPRKGDRVSFEVRDTAKGPRAYNVVLLYADHDQAA